MKYKIKQYKTRDGVEHLEKCVVWYIIKKHSMPVYIGDIKMCKAYITEENFKNSKKYIRARGK